MWVLDSILVEPTPTVVIKEGDIWCIRDFGCKYWLPALVVIVIVMVGVAGILYWPSGAFHGIRLEILVFEVICESKMLEGTPTVSPTVVPEVICCGRRWQLRWKWVRECT